MPNYELDSLDRRILVALQSEGRLTNLELADRVGLSPSPCLRRVRRLEAEGYIQGYGARLNRHKIGLGLTAFIRVTLERHHKNDVEQFSDVMRGLPEVISCYVTSGDHDFLLVVAVRSLAEYRRFVLEALPNIRGVRTTHSSFAIDVVKENAPLELRELS